MAAPSGNRFLLTAAVTRYPRDPGLDRPELAEDVERVASLLTSDFGYTHIPLPGDSPTQAQLRDGLRKFCRAPERDPDDLVAVYLACHGEILEPDDFVLLPSDIDPDDLLPLAVSSRDLIGWLLRDTSVKRLLLMLDACYSGQGGQDAAQAAVRWIHQPTAADSPGVVLVAATHPWQQAQPGVFSRAFERAVGQLASGGHAQQDLPLDAVVGVINADPAKPTSQTVACHALGLTGRPPPFLPNPRYRASLIDTDLLEQERARYAEQSADHLRDRFLPATRWFTGRHAALTDLTSWLGNTATPPALVVTGHAGSGKTALLGLLATLSDSDQAPTVSRDGLPSGFAVPEGAITEAIYAGTMTTGQVRDRIAAAVGLRVDTTAELITSLIRRGTGTPTVLIDALDEAADPPGLVSGLLRPLMREARGTLRLLLGTRPHMLTAKLLGKPDTGHYVPVDLDSIQYADPASIRTYIRHILLSGDPLDSAYQPSGLYRTAPIFTLDAVTEAIAEAAGTSFLVARITAATEATATTLPNPKDRAWRQALPRRAGQAMRRDLSLRLGEDADKAARLLLPLAYAQGNGLPWEDIWPGLAEALSPGHGYGNEDLIWLRKAAGSYAIEGLANGRSVYRLYHQALAEHLLESRGQRADQHAIVSTLTSLAPSGSGGNRDWAAAHPYTRAHLSTHAVQAGRIDDLLGDPAYMLSADRAQLLAAVGAASSKQARAAAEAYRQAAHHLRTASVQQHASYLQFAARCARAAHLADALGKYIPRGTWSCTWASWRLTPPHRTFTGHTSSVHAVAATELDDRPVVISGSSDGSVRVWDLVTGASVGNPLTGHSGWVNAVATAELDGRPVVISGSADHSVRVWDLATGAPLGGPLTGHASSVHAVAAAVLDGRPVVISGSSDGSVRVWDLVTGASVGNPLTGHSGWVNAVATAELDGRPVVISGSADHSVRVWDLATGAPLGGPLTGHSGWVNAVATVEVDGRPVVISGSSDGSVRVWDLATGAPAGDPLTGHASWVITVTATELDGRPVVISGSADRSVRVWDLATGAPVGRQLTGHADWVRAVATAELDGRPVVISGSDDGSVRVWDLAASAPLDDQFTGHTGSVNAVATAELDGRPVVISGGGDAVRVWDLATSAPLDKFTGHTGSVNAVVAAELDGRPVVISGSDDGSVRVWDLATSALVCDPLSGHAGWVRAVVSAELGGRPVVISGGGDGVRVWDLATGAPVGGSLTRARISDPSAGDPIPVRAVAAIVLDGRPVVISGGDDGSVRVWDLATGAPAGDPLVGHASWVGAVATAELEGRPVVISGSGDGCVGVWDLATSTPIGDLFTGHASPVNAVATAELDGRPVAISGSDDGTVRVWDLATGALVGDPFTGHTGSVNAVATAELDGRPVVISGSDDLSVRVWDLAPAERVSDPFSGGAMSVRVVATAELDGRSVVVSGGDDGTVRVWDLATGALVGDLFTDALVGDLFTGQTGSVNAVATAELDGRPVVISGRDDGSVRVWDLATGEPVSDPFADYAIPVRAVALAELDGRPVVISGRDDGSVRVWDLATGTLVGGIFTRRTSRADTGRDDGSMRVWDRVWDLATGALVGLFTRRTSRANTVIATELEGRPVVISGEQDGSVRAWDLAKRRALRYHFRRVRLRHVAPVHAAVLTRFEDRFNLITGCADGVSCTWDLSACRTLSRTIIPGRSGIGAIITLAPDYVVYASGGTILMYEATNTATPILTIELDSEIRALAALGISTVVAATRLGLVSLEVPH